MIHTTEALDWCVAHIYQQSTGSTKVKLTLPFEDMRSLCQTHSLFPALGSREANYAAFKDWLDKHDCKDKFYVTNVFGIHSLVSLFDWDLRNTAKIQSWGDTSDGE